MIYGLYTAASGAFVEDARADMSANNLANLDTVGFRKDFMSFAARGPQSRQVDATPDFAYANDVLDQLGGGVVLHRVSRDLSSGALQKTGRKLDIALEDEGYFAVERDGKRFYTRAGNFALDPTGRLVTMDGRGSVLGAGGETITLADSERTSLTDQGQFILDGDVVGQLELVRFADPSELRKVGDSLYVTAQEEEAYEGTVEQGVLERSTVNAVAEMVNLIRGFRAYEADLAVVRNLDTTLDRVANEVARLPR
ncbi:MAG: flagellar hook-basal body protein [Planctomycetota bacterium]